MTNEFNLMANGGQHVRTYAAIIAAVQRAAKAMAA
jgi:hypothetical protein